MIKLKTKKFLKMTSITYYNQHSTKFKNTTIFFEENYHHTTFWKFLVMPR